MSSPKYPASVDNSTVCDRPPVPTRSIKYRCLMADVAYVAGKAAQGVHFGPDLARVYDEEIVPLVIDGDSAALLGIVDREDAASGGSRPESWSRAVRLLAELVDAAKRESRL
jgi:hypothetical protein